MPPEGLPGEVFEACPTGSRQTQDKLEGQCLLTGLDTLSLGCRQDWCRAVFLVFGRRIN